MNGNDAAKMRSACPAGKYLPVVGWLADARILTVAGPGYSGFDLALGRGRTRLCRVKLPLIAWLAGVRKPDMSWTATRIEEGAA